MMQPTTPAQNGELTNIISQLIGSAENYEQAAACLSNSLNRPDLGPMLRQATQGLSNRAIMMAVREGCRGALSAAEVENLSHTFHRCVVGAVCCAEVQGALDLLDHARESRCTTTLAQSIDSARATLANLLSNHHYFSHDFVAKRDIRLTVEDFYSSPYKLFSAKLCVDAQDRMACSTGEELLELYHVLQSARFFLELQRDFDNTRRDVVTSRATAKNSAILLSKAVDALEPHLSQLGVCLCAAAPSAQEVGETLETLRKSPQINAVFSSRVKGAADTCHVRISCFNLDKGLEPEMPESDSIHDASLLLAKKPLLRYLASGGTDLSVRVLDSSKKLPRSILEEVGTFAKTGVLLESFFGRPVEVNFCHVNLRLHILGLKFPPKR